MKLRGPPDIIWSLQALFPNLWGQMNSRQLKTVTPSYQGTGIRCVGL